MSPTNHPKSKEPVLILTDQDYRRAFSDPEPEPRARPEPVRQSPAKTRRWPVALGLVGFVALGAASIGGVAWLGWKGFQPAPHPVAAARAPRRFPKPVEPPPPSRSPEPRPAVILQDVDEPEAPPPPAVAPAQAPPWNGGRAWARLRLRIERGPQAQESEHRVLLVWNGARFVVDRRASSRPDPALDRLELLLHLPSEEESWRRQVTGGGAESLRVDSRALECRRVDGVDRFPEGVRRFRYWYSEEFPAGAVQAEQRMGEFTLVSRVLEFGAVPAEEKAGR